VGAFEAGVKSIGVMLGAEGFCAESGFFLCGCEWYAVVAAGILTIRRTCSGVGGLGGRFPEWSFLGGVFARSAIVSLGEGEKVVSESCQPLTIGNGRTRNKNDITCFNLF